MGMGNEWCESYDGPTYCLGRVCQRADHGGDLGQSPVGFLSWKDGINTLGRPRWLKLSRQSAGEERACRKKTLDLQRTPQVSGRALTSVRMQANVLKLGMQSSARITRNGAWCSECHRVRRSTCSNYLDWITGLKKLKNLKELEIFLTKYKIWKLAPDQIVNPKQFIITRNKVIKDKATKHIRPRWFHKENLSEL